MIWTLTLNAAVDRTMVVERLASNEVLRAQEVHDRAGGKGVNVLRTVHELGGEAEGLVLLGGTLGNYFRELCDPSWQLAIVPIAGQTRLNVSVVDRDRRAAVKVNEPGPMIGPAELDATLELLESRLDGGWLAICGAVPEGVDEHVISAIAEVARAQGTFVAVDVPLVAPETLAAIAPDVLKLNLFELDGLLAGPQVGGEAAVSAACELRAGTGAGVVIVGLGGDGAILASADGTLRLAVPDPVTAKPVGAGDALLGGFLLGRQCGLGIDRSFAYGMAAAILSAHQRGPLNSSAVENVADALALELHPEGDPCR